MDKTSKVWAAFFLAAIAFLLLFASYDSYTSYQKTKNWVPVEAVIASSKLESGNGVHLDITARLGKNTKEIPIDLIYGTFISQKNYRDLAEDYPAGTQTTVFQNPDSPEDVVLMRSDHINPFLYVWITLSALIFVLLVRILNR